jgi:squalene synthase HpnC
MTRIADLQSGKGHKDENFPVASVLIAPRFRPPILAFYRFVRMADDIADHATAPAPEKLALLEEMRASLTGERDSVPEGVALRAVLAERNISAIHALDLLEAFRRDVTKSRYADWDDLLDYCRYSAMPVGRFVLDVHGESPGLWPANDALCAALQVINHLQDCGKDYRTLNRVYIPQDGLAAERAGVEALGADKAGAPLMAVLEQLSRRTTALLYKARPFAAAITNSRLALEVDLIQTLAEDLNRLLMTRDPLSQPVHHSRTDVLGLFLKRFPRFAWMRLRRHTGRGAHG